MTTAPKVIFMLSHSEEGGASNIWADLAQAFAAKGYRVQLAALYPKAAGVLSKERLTQVEWIYAVPDRPRSLLGSAGMFWSLVKLLRRERPDVVFTALPAANAIVPLAAQVSGTGLRVVTSHHGPISTARKYLDVADTLAGSLPSVDTIISVSHSVSNTLSSKPTTYRKKRAVIHNALPPRIEANLEALYPAGSRRTMQARLLAATGRLAEQKNYPTLLRAVANTREIHLNIVGSGPDEQALRDLSDSLGLQSRVSFLGSFPREEALGRLSQADVFIQVSLFEGHSLAIIEAAKLGLPIIVSDVPEQIEAVTLRDGSRAGIVVPTLDPESIGAAIQQLFDSAAEYRLWSDRASMLAKESNFDNLVCAYEAIVNQAR
ncbi:MAG: glycosyltransferase [Sphingomonadales bacterium]|nr:MAG: glycosyltransferase [Sphingomonadales bacterium]